MCGLWDASNSETWSKLVKSEKCLSYEFDIEAQTIFHVRIMSKGPLREKSFALASLILALSKELTAQNEFVLSRQILRSGTNPGAMVREAANAESKRDFIHKLKIAQKEVGETQYWLELLLDGDYISKARFDKIYSLSDEIMKMIRSSVLTTMKNL